MSLISRSLSKGLPSTISRTAPLAAAAAPASLGYQTRSLSSAPGGPYHQPYYFQPQSSSSYLQPRYATTILSVRKGGKVAVVGDGQMTQGSVVMKPNAVKVRRVGEDVIVGFAGATADAMTLMERLEGKLDTYSNQLMRACVELAKDWRTEKYLRRLEAAMIVANKDVTLEVTGMGDVIEPVDGVLAIGSGGDYATAAARALMSSDATAMEIAERSMEIAANMCIYTNNQFVKDEMDANESNLELLRLQGKARPDEDDRA
eukprot:gb/GECG01016037.1/.p1 GENE.gb/GECG01016037.1/~~gb/GECG01016037.1/.p1  ORF type:complete len:260 (+),score=35.01 gb/GECG01016037.1/:1-780(+)